MMIITHWRPVAIGPGQDLSAVIDEVLSMVEEYAKCERRIAGHQYDEYYYNEVGPEFVAVQKLERFSVLDEVEADPQNTELGLRLMRLGFGIHAVEYLRELPALRSFSEGLRALAKR